VVELDPAHGTVLGRTRLPRGTNAGPIAVDGDVWVVDAERRALVRVGAYTRREVSR
jgi:streptogramin lyase